MKAVVVTYAADLAGLLSHALVVAGVWGRFGWPFGLIALGAPFALFYFWGEYLKVAGGNQ